MYTNHTYETASKSDVTESVPNSRIESTNNNNNKQIKLPTKHSIAASLDDHKRISDNRHCNHHRHHSRKG